MTINFIITDGIGTPSDIPHFILNGLNQPTTSSSLSAPFRSSVFYTPVVRAAAIIAFCLVYFS